MSESATRLNEAFSGRYTIERELGQGGMATVYLADDLKHDRKVAIKVLKPELAAVIGAERFLAEIKTTANLQHPHILPLFDSGEADGFLYYVMPFVEGESLRDRLDREKQLPIAEAVELAADIASALQYAHDRDVIHRDIKPANILLHAGQPVVADFGIALAVSQASDGRMTETGLSLGTPHYMSPEQATADRDLTARSDVYAVGCVLYEMLGGQPPYTGPSAQSVLVRILTEDPRDLIDLRRSVPRHVAAAVDKAIEKLPADRFESAQALVDALADENFRYERVVRTGAQAAVVGVRAPAVRRGGVGGRLPWAVVAGMAGLSVWGWLNPEAPLQVSRTELNLPAAELTTSHAFRPFDISPDGRTLAYLAGPTRTLHIRNLGRLSSREVAGTEDSRAPVFSPDGRSVLIRSSETGDLKTVSLDGAPPRTIVAGNNVPGADWGDDGFVYFVRNFGIFRVPATGGDPEPVLVDTTGVEGFIFPHALPGGEGLLVSSAGDETPEGSWILEVLDLASGARTTLVQGAGGHYLPTGHVVFATSEGVLSVFPFDLKTFEAGPATILAERVSLLSLGQPEFAVSDAGHLVYQEGSGAVTATEEVVSVIDRTGNTTQVAPNRLTGDFEAAAVSPDGRYIAVVSQPGNSSGDLWIYDQVQETFGPLPTALTGREDFPHWSANGDTLYHLLIGGEDPPGVYRVPADASGPSELVFTADFDIEDFDMPADGRYMVFKVDGPAGNNDDIWYVDLQGDSVPVPFLTTPADEEGIGISPDGRWLAYESNESGRDEVYVRAFPGGGARTQISLDGGLDPVWSHLGTELFYHNRASRSLLVAQLEVGETVSVTDRDELFSVDAFELGGGEIVHAVGPDDETFYYFGDRASTELVDEEAGVLVLVLNWIEEIKALGAGGGN